MRTAIISDIHANLEALEAVREALRELLPDRVVNLGDVVGYGADPEECVEIVIREGWPTLMGNHDAAVCDPAHIEPMNPMARAALEWTAAKLPQKSRNFLASLPMTLTLDDDAIASHGLPFKPGDWIYSDDPQAVLLNFNSVPQKYCFIGHLHYAHAYRFDPDKKKMFLAHLPESVDLSSGRHAINVGSVGQPRDDDHRACFVIYDDQAETAIYQRVQYDTVLAAKKIVDAGLPEILAQRLFLGR